MMANKIRTAAIGLVAIGCGGKPPSTPFEPASSESVVGRNVSDLELGALGRRKAVRMSEFRGKAVLLNVWASWCAPCKQELPMLDDAAERLRAKDVVIVAVSVDESTEEAEDFLRLRPSWALVFAHAPARKGLDRFEMRTMPTSYVIDRNGVIRSVYPDSDRQDFRKIEADLVP